MSPSIDLKRTLPQPVRYSGDDFSMTVNGETIYPHVGEYVEVWPVLSMREVRRCARLVALIRRGVEYMDADELKELDTEAQMVMQITAENIMSWNLTDLRTGEPLPKATAKVLDDLSPAEFTWVMQMFTPELELGEREA